MREAFSGPHCMDASDGCKAVPPSKWGDCSRIWYWADGNPTEGDWTRPRPSIHMPRWASRITLEVTGVRVERLQDISRDDAISEGVDPHRCPTQQTEASMRAQLVAHRIGMAAHYVAEIDYIGGFRWLWESINGAGSWDANPWVWVIEFRKV